MKEWQIADAAEPGMPTPDQWREKLGLQKDEVLPYGRICKLDFLKIAERLKPKFITADMVKEGVIVLDFGGSWIQDPATGKKKTVGDIDFDSVKEKASFITPVPGGIGPMLVTMLMANTVKAAKSGIR